jgi:hypothetical protein
MSIQNGTAHNLILQLIRLRQTPKQMTHVSLICVGWNRLQQPRKPTRLLFRQMLQLSSKLMSAPFYKRSTHAPIVVVVIPLYGFQPLHIGHPASFVALNRGLYEVSLEVIRLTNRIVREFATKLL